MQSSNVLSYGFKALLYFTFLLPPSIKVYEPSKKKVGFDMKQSITVSFVFCNLITIMIQIVWANYGNRKKINTFNVK